MKKIIDYIKSGKLINSIVDKKIYFIISIIVLVIDIVSKFYAQKYLTQIEYKNIIGNQLIFVFVKNYGVVFGILNDLPKPFDSIIGVGLKYIVAVAMVMVFIFMLFVDKKKQPVSMIGFCFILGGAMGNLLDRIMRGYVTDFISMGITKTFRFPYIYNVADAFITVGIGIIILATLILKEDAFKELENKKYE